MEEVESIVEEVTTEKDWNALKQEASVKCIVVKFFAVWCGACKIMIDKFEAIAQEYKDHQDIRFVKINIETLEDLASEFDVSALPTFVLLKEGKEIERALGPHQELLETMVKKHCTVA
ncbi:hypothetical protein Ciccas_008381 [Cichlidogyrus casuarinus]|uniref:Thioredoxin domain-containing protein n=1 Tax=Cichlidogyrus casuarinus TaxID=1844966 RepID=A0ABD2Q2Q4_9PLAT